MADQILILCKPCAELMRGGFDVVRASFDDIKTNAGSFRRPLHGKKCENCGQSFGVLGRYLVRKKG